MSNAAPVIIGSDHTKFGRLDARTLEDLMVEAAGEALLASAERDRALGVSVLHT